MNIKISIGYGRTDAQKSAAKIIEVRDLTYTTAPRPEMVEKEKEVGSGCVVWHESYEEGAAKRDYLSLVYADSKGADRVIITNCPTYLMNNEGKTMEILLK